MPSTEDVVLEAESAAWLERPGAASSTSAESGLAQDVLEPDAGIWKATPWLIWDTGQPELSPCKVPLE